MPTVAPSGPSGVRVLSARFFENGAGTYTADFKLPANSVVLDIVATAEALWTAATSAALIVGNADDDDGFIASTNLKATDLLVGESISIGGGLYTGGGKLGADATVGTNTHIVDRFYSSGGTITAKVTSVGAGTAGRTRVDVIYAQVNPTTIRKS